MKQLSYPIVLAAVLTQALAGRCLENEKSQDTRVANLAMKGDRAGVAALLKRRSLM